MVAVQLLLACRLWMWTRWCFGHGLWVVVPRVGLCQPVPVACCAVCLDSCFAGSGAVSVEQAAFGWRLCVSSCGRQTPRTKLSTEELEGGHPVRQRSCILTRALALGIALTGQGIPNAAETAEILHTPIWCAYLGPTAARTASRQRRPRSLPCAVYKLQPTHTRSCSLSVMHSKVSTF